MRNPMRLIASWAIVVVCLLKCAEASAEEMLPPETAVHEAIDYYVESKLRQDEIEPAALVDDANLIRRTMLDLAGRVPAAAEAQNFVDSSAADKRIRLIDRLLDAPDFNFHHRNQLDSMLLAGRSSPKEWREYLLKAVEENRGWDQMFREMMAGRDDNPDEKPALAFLKTHVKELDRLTNETSRLFFGVSINCAQCHDHPLVDDWKQDHFFGMTAFFDRTYLTKKDTLAEKYSGVVKFKTTEGEEKTAQFMFLSGRAVEEPAVEKTDEERKAEDEEVKRQQKDADAPTPKDPDFSPRRQLVDLALDDDQGRFFARSIVNRIWHRLLGRGLVDPLDQMHSANPPSHPELLDWLARDLVEHGYDLKRLIRGIVLSDTYARSSRWDGEGDPPSFDYFAVAVPRPLTPHQYSLSLLIATSNPDSYPPDIPADDWKKRREGLENAANGFAGLLDLPGDNFQVSVDEALLFSNNERIYNEYLRDGGDKLVGYLKAIPDRRAMIEAAFWSVLIRTPSAEEVDAFENYLVQREDRPVDGIQQILWALVASPELRFNY
jgi:hypothetical protein